MGAFTRCPAELHPHLQQRVVRGSRDSRDSRDRTAILVLTCPQSRARAGGTWPRQRSSAASHCPSYQPGALPRELCLT